MADSISIEIHDRCPAGLEIFQNERLLSVNFTASGGVGDLEIVNPEKEVIALVQKHLSTISLLENTSRSEVLTVEAPSPDSSTDDRSLMPISCPPTEEVAAVTNVRVGLFQPNTLEIVSRGRYTDSRAMDFRWETCDSSSLSNKGSDHNPTPPPNTGSNPVDDNELAATQYNYRIVNNASVTVADVFLRRNASHAVVRFVEEQHLTPKQIAVIFGGLSFLVLSVKKQRSLVRLTTLLLLLILCIAVIVLVSVGVQ